MTGTGSIAISLIAAMTLVTTLCRGAENYDVVVYGGTPGGIISAISASREGLSVVLLEQENHGRTERGLRQ